MRPDSARTAADVKRVFNAYLSNSGTPVPSNFSIRRPTGFLGRHPGELMIAGVIVARSRVFGDLLEALSGHFAALATTARPVEEPRVRAFSDGTRVVLTDLPRPGLVSDPELTTHRVVELHLWNPDFAEGPVIALPQALAQLSGLHSAPLPPTMRVAGAVLTAESAGLDQGYGWLHALRRMGAIPPPQTVGDDEAARRAILSLFDHAGRRPVL